MTEYELMKQYSGRCHDDHGSYCQIRLELTPWICCHTVSKAIQKKTCDEIFEKIFLGSLWDLGAPSVANVLSQFYWHHIITVMMKMNIGMNFDMVRNTMEMHITLL